MTPNHSLLAGVILLLGMACVPGRAWGQRAEMQAVPGRPFGVAAITLPSAPHPWTASELRIEERDQRVFYPAFSSGGLLRLLASDGELDGTEIRTVLFLFTGNAPLQITLHGPTSTTLTLRPESQPPRVHNRLFQRWWREYNNSAKELTQQGDYPPLIQTYLTGMLGTRLGLRPPLLARLTADPGSEEQELWERLFGAERLYHEKLRETLAGARDSAVADQPVPPARDWPLPAVRVEERPEVESMAEHVPEECFYIRFGNFDNYLWMEDLLTTYGGDIGSMVQARGQDSRASDRIRTQLSLPQTILSKVFGSQLIDDVALIGRDLYMQNGAAIGVLFQARSSTLLSVTINQQRSATAASEKKNGATLVTVPIAGHDVSFLSTPDNRIRSYYAIDRNYHLVTTSRHLVERFFEAGEGKGVLATLPEFQSARSRIPLRRNDTIFAFLSTPFLSGLLSPQYQVELNRRLQALVDLELVRLAQLAAAAEQQPSDSIAELVEGGFLPRGFGRQPDGSGPILEEGRALDSLRGARGTFTPIPDIEFTLVSASESARYRSLSESQFAQWQQLDPLTAVIKREPLDNQRERVTLEATISPLAEAKYGKFLSVLGPPSVQQVVPREGDVIYGQASVTGGAYSNLIPPHLLFAGVQDLAPPESLGSPNGWLQTLRVLRILPAYLGAWPKPGFIDWLPILGNQPVAPDGYSRLPLDLWRWQGDGFSVLSFHRPILEGVVPQLIVADSDDAAQIRVRVEDLSESNLKPAIDDLYYQRSRQTSLANTRLLNALTQQLRVPPAEARTVAESLLDTRLICPLHGKYQLVETESGHAYWESTAVAGTNGDVPADYRSPLLQWFRGLEFRLTKVADRVTVHSQVEMQRK